jgi:hypothetical protein
MIKIVLVLLLTNVVEDVLPESGLFGDLVNESEYQPTESVTSNKYKTSRL